LDQDGWAYWQGAVSLTEGKGYTYFSGHPIVAWPPLYSLYLAAWTSILGPYADTLIIANGFLIIIQAYFWFQLCLFLTSDLNITHSYFPTLFSTLYIGAFISLNQSPVEAHILLYTLLPIFLLIVWLSIHQTNRAVWRSYTVASCLAAVCMLTHNSSVVFVAAASIMIILLGRNSIYGRIGGGALISVFSFAVWATVRQYLGQSGSHSPGGYFSINQYAMQASEGIGELIVPKILALPCVLLFLSVAIYICLYRRRGGLIFALLFSIFSLIMLIVVFSVVYLHAQTLDGRFVWFIPLLIVPLLLLESARLRTEVFVMVLCMAIPILMYRSLKWSFWIDPQGLVFPSAELSRVPAAGKSVVINGRTLVGPIGWEEPIGREGWEEREREKRLK
jgi:hypothetical protein